MDAVMELVIMIWAKLNPDIKKYIFGADSGQYHYVVTVERKNKASARPDRR